MRLQCSGSDNGGWGVADEFGLLEDEGGGGFLFIGRVAIFFQDAFDGDADAGAGGLRFIEEGGHTHIPLMASLNVLKEGDRLRSGIMCRATLRATSIFGIPAG